MSAPAGAGTSPKSPPNPPLPLQRQGQKLLSVRFGKSTDPIGQNPFSTAPPPPREQSLQSLAHQQWLTTTLLPFLKKTSRIPFRASHFLHSLIVSTEDPRDQRKGGLSHRKWSLYRVPHFYIRPQCGLGHPPLTSDPSQGWVGPSPTAGPDSSPTG